MIKSSVIAQLDRQTSSRLAVVTAASCRGGGLLNQQRRTLMVPHVSTWERKRGKKRIFVPRAQRATAQNYDKPTMDVAQALPLSFQEMDNSTLVTLGNMGDHEACKEMLKRHIMDIDSCDYDTAKETFKEIAEKNIQGNWILSLPYRLGMAAALTAGFGSFPMVFDIGTATWFNEYYVTTDVPEPADLETALEVGSWTWNVRMVACSTSMSNSLLDSFLTHLLALRLGTVDGTSIGSNFICSFVSSICK